MSKGKFNFIESFETIPSDINVGNNWIVNLRGKHILHRHTELDRIDNLYIAYSSLRDSLSPSKCNKCDKEVPANIRIIMDLQRLA